MIRSALALLLLALAMAGCDRPRVDPFDSLVVVRSPDLDLVQIAPQLSLRFDTASPLVATVRIGGLAVERGGDDGGFVYEATLARGLNAFPLEVTDEAGRVTYDTLYALHYPIQFSGPLVLTQSNFRRAGAAAAAFDGARVLVSGGVTGNGTVSSTAAIVTVSGSQIDSREVSLRAARTGHTASLLPDGNVLLLGGVRTAGAPTSADFVTEAETVAPSGQGVVAAPSAEVARAAHTTRVLTRDGRTYVYVYGGIVPAGSGTAESGTVDIFEYVPGAPARLDRLTPPGGAGDFPALAQGVQVPTAALESVVFGLSKRDEDVAQRLVWRTPGTLYPFSLTSRAARPLITPREAAAGTPLEGPGGLALVAGGRSGQGQPLASIEVYASAIDRTFRFPAEASLASPRFSHTATILSGGRILIAGGYGPSGAALPFLEILQL